MFHLAIRNNRGCHCRLRLQQGRSWESVTIGERKFMLSPTIGYWAYILSERVPAHHWIADGLVDSFISRERATSEAFPVPSRCR